MDGNRQRRTEKENDTWVQGRQSSENKGEDNRHFGEKREAKKLGKEMYLGKAIT